MTFSALKKKILITIFLFETGYRAKMKEALKDD
jgi:hypothetical protein